MRILLIHLAIVAASILLAGVLVFVGFAAMNHIGNVACSAEVEQ